jgi:hypothetical protein
LERQTLKGFIFDIDGRDKEDALARIAMLMALYF